MTKPILTQSLLKELVHYDPETGVFTWLERNIKWFKDGHRSAKCQQGIWNGRFSGKIVGAIDPLDGYRTNKIFGKKYRQHRLAWMYVYGDSPALQIDHINHIRHDNRISNLRETDQKENTKNSSLSSNNNSGFTGVMWDKGRKKWRAEIMIDGKNKYLGRYVNFEDAVAARKYANIKYGFHLNHGYCL